MSYERDLDEFTTERLEAELQARRKARHDHLCDYCFKPYSDPKCKFPERHGIQDETGLDHNLRVLGEIAEAAHGWPEGARNTYVPSELPPMVRTFKFCERLVKHLIGDGYTLVLPGDVTKAGDEYLATFRRSDGKIAFGWVRIPNPGWMVGAGSAYARRAA